MTLRLDDKIEREPTPVFNLKVALGMAATVAVWAALVRPTGGSGVPLVLQWFAAPMLPYLPNKLFDVIMAIVMVLFSVSSMMFFVIETLLLAVEGSRKFWLWSHALSPFAIAVSFVWPMAGGSSTTESVWLRYLVGPLIATSLIAPPLALVECWLRVRRPLERSLACWGCGCTAALYLTLQMMMAVGFGE